MGNQDTELGNSLRLIETVDTGRTAVPQQKAQHPKATGKSDYLILLGDGRADHMGKGAAERCSQERKQVPNE